MAHEELAEPRRRRVRPGEGALAGVERVAAARAQARASSSASSQQKRIADSLADIYAQIAVLSRVTSIFEDQGVEPSGQERYIAETFCTRAAGRVRRDSDQIERNDDERMTAIAKLAYKRGEYGYALFEK